MKIGENKYMRIEINEDNIGYEIVTSRYIDNNKFPRVWTTMLDGNGMKQLTDILNIYKAKEQYDKYQIGDIIRIDKSSLPFKMEIAPMTDEVLEIIASEKSSWPYQFLRPQYRSDPELLKKVLINFQPYEYHGPRELYNPISYALPSALTEENIELAVSKRWRTKFLVDSNGQICKKIVLDYLKRNYPLSNIKYDRIEKENFIGPYDFEDLLAGVKKIR